ncbi:hypothetical protein QTP88_002710 [Uroleucon formosanum]
MDNAPYHSVQTEKYPTSNSNKAVLLEWLNSKGITFDRPMLKAQLLTKVQELKPRTKSYVIDNLAKDAGHTVLRLPPYHCEFNPIELAWAMLENNQNKEIGGPGLFVEIDESLFVRRKNNAGRILPQQWIFGGICRETKACFIISVPDRSEKTLLPIIQRYIRPGSIILSDCWKAYNNLQQVGFKHNTVNHTYNFVDPDTGAHTQHIERLWGSAKWGNKKRRGTNRNFLESYLAEFMWRTRLGEQDAFETILKDISEIWPPL